VFSSSSDKGCPERRLIHASLKKFTQAGPSSPAAVVDENPLIVKVLRRAVDMLQSCGDERSLDALLPEPERGVSLTTAKFADKLGRHISTLERAAL
jgi:hypothetical protein